MAASSFGAQLALFFTFVFQVQGELVVQSDNVTFPPYADLPAMFGPPIPAGEERLLGVLKVSPFEKKEEKKMTPSQPVLTLASSTTLFRNDGDDDNSLRTRWTPARP